VAAAHEMKISGAECKVRYQLWQWRLPSQKREAQQLYPADIQPDSGGLGMSLTSDGRGLGFGLISHPRASGNALGA
jgi:hypothetical protein